MKSIPLIVDQQIIANYPALRIGVVVGHGIHNASADAELMSLTHRLEDNFVQTYRSEDISKHHCITAWRQTYRSFGTNPRDYRPTAEALLRRIARGDRLPVINVVVSCYLLAELEYFLPIGGYDLASIDELICLRLSQGGERFRPLGGKESETTYPGEVVYADKSKVLTRRWNYRDSDEAKITESTTGCVLLCEGADDSIQTRDIENCMITVSEYVKRFCGGEVGYFLADVTKGNAWEI